MDTSNQYDVVIIGGSNAGLSAAMSLARALKRVMIIDSGLPCNRQTPHSHNFMTHDGWRPAEIQEVAKNEVLSYDTVTWLAGTVSMVAGSNCNFEVLVEGQNSTISARKLLFATGVKDLMPNIKGFADCWGISVIHCPYCHGYEYRGKVTGIMMNNEHAADFAKFIQNWTPNLTLFTNGTSVLTPEQTQATLNRNIRIIETEIAGVNHYNGHLTALQLADGSVFSLDALYARLPFKQHCHIPEQQGCSLTDDGYLEVTEQKRTTVPGIFAAGDNTSPMRSVAAAVGAGNLAGAMIAHELINEE
jgi:thioredoxin reductase